MQLLPLVVFQLAAAVSQQTATLHMQMLLALLHVLSIRATCNSAPALL
jgi:hypothetical protein